MLVGLVDWMREQNERVSQIATDFTLWELNGSKNDKRFVMGDRTAINELTESTNRYIEMHCTQFGYETAVVKLTFKVLVH